MTIPTYPIEPRDYAAERVFVQHFGHMFKNLVRQYMPKHPVTEQQDELLAQMQNLASCYDPFVWTGPMVEPSQVDKAGNQLARFSDENSPAKPKNDGLLRAALHALEYHQAQTRPIQLTIEVIGAIRTYFNEAS